MDNSKKKEIYPDDKILDSYDSCRTITESIRAHSIYQMMVYTVTDGKIKIPLHVMTGQSIYSRFCSLSTITSLNKIGDSASYDNV